MTPLPASVGITEVGPRDGLQSHSHFVPTDKKIAMIDRLSATGFDTIEATSFAHPDAVPNLRDAEAVMAGIQRRPGTRYRALVPNERGAQRAVDSGPDDLLGLVTASESYNRRNQNRSVDESVDEAMRAHAVAREARLGFTMAIGMAFYCPFEGLIDPDRVVGIAETLHSDGIRRFYVAGSIGFEDPSRVSDLVQRLSQQLPDAEIGFHVHDLAGFGAANAYAALVGGARFFEGSICGLGGGMHAPTGSSNLATEDLVHILAACGVDTGLHPSDVLEAAVDIGELLGLEPRSRVVHSGVRPDLERGDGSADSRGESG